MPLHLIPCTPKELPLLVELGRETFKDAFAEANDPKDFQAYIEKAFSKKRIQAELNNPHSFFYLVYSDDKLAGYFKLNYLSAQTDIKSKEGAELERIYVLKAFQNQHIGQWMLEQAIKLAGKIGKDFLWLGVWEKNPGAIRFYERNGFEKFGKHPYYVGSDKQMDWLMKLDLLPS
ncbi:MAG: GNAT family N-acetyltransferase [Bacteroidia bacterium]|nr:GNAT family N-acetyltransferase [Bacteroidia bacterium]